jgi:hypothetical protein
LDRLFEQVGKEGGRVREKDVPLPVSNKHPSRRFDPLAIDPPSCFRTHESDNPTDVIRYADATKRDV